MRPSEGEDVLRVSVSPYVTAFFSLTTAAICFLHLLKPLAYIIEPHRISRVKETNILTEPSKTTGSARHIATSPEAREEDFFIAGAHEHAAARPFNRGGPSPVARRAASPRQMPPPGVCAAGLLVLRRKKLLMSFFSYLSIVVNVSYTFWYRHPLCTPIFICPTSEARPANIEISESFQLAFQELL
ncbi:hypothetical protein EVAR_41777_1 [Eumeta japonica]|uniref:Uncharacterized protein n=1 Tax=Eumeta variegata TaxID=151549 RepID=A0A4C1VZA3_EUMVA|nr:hypothetical protein EVAR_41777_1 [Eumeta japonica]